MQDYPDFVRISVSDSGAGISAEIIEKVYHDRMPGNQIGLYNVHRRVKLIYGQGLTIRRLEQELIFYLMCPKEMP